MTGHLTLESKSEVVLRYVADFARGLGCDVAGSHAHAIRIALPDSSDALLELLSHVALSATRAGVEISEPRCQISFQHDKAPSVVSLALRLDAFNIDAASSGPAVTAR